jgi:hypothetical protein
MPDWMIRTLTIAHPGQGQALGHLIVQQQPQVAPETMIIGIPDEDEEVEDGSEHSPEREVLSDPPAEVNVRQNEGRARQHGRRRNAHEN